MMQEAVEIPPPVVKPALAEVTKSQKNFFFSGAFETKQALETVNKHLGGVYQPENVVVVNSILSSDRPEPGKYNKLASQLSESISQGPTRIMIHSSGLVEFDTVLKEILKQQPNFLQTLNPKNMEVVLISPFGMWKGIREAASYVPRLAKLGLAGMGVGSIKGIESLLLVPPEGIDRSQLTALLSQTYPELSQLNKGDGSGVLRVDNFTPIDYRQLGLTLTPEQQTELTRIDRDLKTAVDGNNTLEFKRIMQQRQKLLSSFLDTAYRGGYPQIEQQTEINNAVTETAKVYAQAMRGFARTITADNPAKRIAELKTRGVQIQCLVPEQDVIYHLNEAQQVTDAIAVLTGFAHATTNLQPGGIVAGLDALKTG